MLYMFYTFKTQNYGNWFYVGLMISDILFHNLFDNNKLFSHIINEVLEFLIKEIL